jgi:iron complex transport system permease protein
MARNTSLVWKFAALSVILVGAIFANLMAGSTLIPFFDIFSTLFFDESSQVNYYIIWELRLPKTIAAILVGFALPLAGLLLQSLFRNPLAGPYVLGISSGASLGVAIFVLLGGSTLYASAWFFSGGISFFAILGAMLVLLAVLGISHKIHDSVSLLIVGIMFGSITGALVSVLQYFSSPELLQRFIIWTFGSLGGIHWHEIGMMTTLVLVSIILSFQLMKPLNVLLINEEYALSLGVSVRKIRFLVIIISSLLAGIVTAFAGPIVFIGIAVPHLARNVFRTNDHRILLPAVLLIGAILMLMCDLIAQLPGSDIVLPINSVTSLVGAPVIIWIIIQNKRIHEAR